jgi:hypothetical protein
LLQASADLWGDLLSNEEDDKKSGDGEVEEAVEVPPPKRKKVDEAVPTMKCALCEKSSQDHRDCRVRECPPMTC